ncbi:hypothetical protein ACI65C_013227 [Semiaphis heraclei]
MASASVSKGTFQPDSDVHITFDDQQKINKFARLNARVDEYRDELKAKQTILKNLEDAAEELMLLDEDDCPNLPYLSGETFVYYNLETAQNNLEELKKTVGKEMKDIETKIKDISSTMSDLKSHLYGKFGNNINLEAED